MTPTANTIHIIGVGADGLAGLTMRARDLLRQADAVIGTDAGLVRELDIATERYRVGQDMPEVVRWIEAAPPSQRIVVVVGGDPLFYGIARYLCDRLGKDRFEVLPHVSSMQLAFARIKESWEEAYLTNLQSHALDAVIDRIRTADTVGLFTTRESDPPTIARQLLARGIDYFRAFVCENLGGPDERITQGELTEIQDMEFAPLNVLILKRKPDRPDLRQATTRFRRFGNPDDVFAQSRPKSGLVTQAEVRAIGLAQLAIQPGDVVWDIGAGSGSVALEAAQLAQPGMVYAIEQDVADYHLIVANAETFGVRNLMPIQGTAPAVFHNLPAPDAIFVGGTGHEVARLLDAAYQALRADGRMVVNVATLEALNAVYTALKALAGRVEATLVQISRGTDQLETLRFEALNPTFLLGLRKTQPGIGR